MNSGYAAVKAGNQAAAALVFDSAATGAPQLAEPRSAAGYAYLAAGRKAEAMTRFETALSLDGERDVIRRQLGYLYADAGRHRDAIAQFSAIRERGRISAQDQLALGNLNNLVGERELAVASFHSALELATQIGDTTVARSARQSIATLSNGAAGSVAWLDYYIAPFYQSRFHNVVSFGFARAGLTAGNWLRPSVYVSLRATRDSKSVGGLQPVLYADNTVLPALGVRIQPGGKWVVLYAEAGAAYPLVDVNPRDWRRDVRAGLIVSATSQHPLSAKTNGMALISDWYGDASWYDRFDRDFITYAQLRESLRLVQGRTGALDVFGRAWSVVDSRNTYSNRVLEGGGGIALHAGASRRVSLYLEGVRGHYLSAPGTQSTRNYNDFRVTLVTGLYHATPLTRP
jgi:tetratricopeptide (TPR) repeat protein